MSDDECHFVSHPAAAPFENGHKASRDIILVVGHYHTNFIPGRICDNECHFVSHPAAAPFENGHKISHPK
jgi:hypothetical protein